MRTQPEELFLWFLGSIPDELPPLHAIHVYCYKSRLQGQLSLSLSLFTGSDHVEKRSRGSLEFAEGNDTFIDLERSLIVPR